MNHLDQPTLKKINFSRLLEETLREFITPKILKNGFEKCGLVPWNSEAVDFSKIPIEENIAQLTINDTKNLQTGIEILEKYIARSLFQVWKNIRKDLKLIDPTRNNTHFSNKNANYDDKENNMNIIINKENEQNTETMNEISLQIIIDENSINNNISNNENTINPDEQRNNKTGEASNENVISVINKTPDGTIIPSPFKRALFWPEVIERRARRTKKEKVPSVVTSKEWQLYHEKKSEEKVRKHMEQEERMAARKLKKEQAAAVRKLK